MSHLANTSPSDSAANTLASVNFSQQYNQNYLARLSQFKKIIPRCGAIPTVTVAEIEGRCTVIATLFLVSNSKHSVLDTFRDSDINNKDDGSRCYVDDNSKYFIEDETGKVFIQIDRSVLPILITGMVLGFTGEMMADLFVCSDIVFPEPVTSGSKEKVKKKLFVASNILFNQNYDKLLSLIYFLSDGIYDVILIGDIFSNLDEMGCKRFEHILRYVKGNIYIVPGINDPTTRMIPQQALHSKLVNIDCIRLENPSKLEIHGHSFVIMNNHILKDIERYVREPVDVLDAVKLLVRIRHILPNAPDTVSCIPYKDKDPFIIEELDFLIAGYGSEAKHEIVDNISLVIVPDFNLTNEGVVIDMNDNKIEIFKIEDAL